MIDFKDITLQDKDTITGYWTKCCRPTRSRPAGGGLSQENDSCAC